MEILYTHFEVEEMFVLVVVTAGCFHGAQGWSFSTSGVWFPGVCLSVWRSQPSGAGSVVKNSVLLEGTVILCGPQFLPRTFLTCDPGREALLRCPLSSNHQLLLSFLTEASWSFSARSSLACVLKYCFHIVCGLPLSRGFSYFRYSSARSLCTE